MGQRGSGPGGRRRPPKESPREFTPRVDMVAARVRLREVIEPVVGEVGYDLEDLGLSRVGRRFLVRVVVDGDRGVSLDAVAVVARAVSAALDAADETGGEILPGEYQLEVGSPGVDRPLTLPRHWRRNVGRLVKVRAGERQLTARVAGADDAGVVLEPAGGAPVEVAYAELGPGHVQVEFSRVEEISDEDLDDYGDDSESELEDEQR